MNTLTNARTWSSSGDEKSARHSGLGIARYCENSKRLDRLGLSFWLDGRTHELEEPLEEDDVVDGILAVL